MNQKIITLFSFILSFGMIHASDKAEKSTKKEIQQEQEKPEITYDAKVVSRSFGHIVANNIQNMSDEFDLKEVMTGIQEHLDKKTPALDEGQCVQQISKIQEAAFKKQADTNLAEAESFLQKNRKNSNVIALEDGKLQYIVLEKGTGATVEENQRPLVKYTGRFLNDKVFGQSEGEALDLSATIPGFSKGLVGMKEGETRKLFLHPDIAFGNSGYFAPNSLVTFEVQVLKAHVPKEENAVENDQVLNQEESGEAASE